MPRAAQVAPWRTDCTSASTVSVALTSHVAVCNFVFTMLDWSFVLAYLSATMVVYLIATFVALRRGVPSTEAAVEAQCAAGGV